MFKEEQTRQLARTFVDVGNHHVAVLTISPACGQARGVLVIVPTFGFEGEDSFRTMVVLAHRGAAAGLLAMVLDLSGAGDSADVPPQADVATTWLADVAATAAHARELAPGVPVNVVGYGVGGTLVSALDPQIADLRVAWEPMTARQFQRRLRLLSAVAAAGPEGLAVNLTGQQLAELRRLDAVAEGADRSGLLVRVAADPRSARLISKVGAYWARVPHTAIADLVNDLRVVDTPVALRSGLEQHDAVMETPDGPVRERLTTLGPHSLSAVVTLPTSGTPRTAVLFTPQGSERAVGPASLWTTIARQLAARGVAAVRCDRRHIGTHTDPDSDREPNPFSPESIDDVETLMQYGASCYERVAVVGSCAGAWLALKAVQRVPVDDVVGCNVPAWPNHLGPFTTEFLDRWNGAQGPDGAQDGADTLAPPSRLIRAVRAVVARWPRAHYAVLLAKAVRSRSVGVPLLRSVPREQQVHLLLSPADTESFRAAGGALLRPRRPRVRLETPQIDHALRRATTQTWIREWILAQYGCLAPSRAVKDGSGVLAATARDKASTSA